MKKFLFALLVLLFFSLYAYCGTYNVMILPYNEELESYINDYFGSVYINDEELEIRTITSAYDVNEQLLRTFDVNFLNLVCDREYADLLLIPLVDEITYAYDLKLYVYERSSESLENVFERISSEDYSFTVSCINSLIPYFYTEDSEIYEQETSSDEEFMKIFFLTAQMQQPR